MQKISTPAGEYTVYRGAEAPRAREQHDPDRWYFEPGDYVGFTVFSESYETETEARRAAIDCGAREEVLKNEIGGGG